MNVTFGGVATSYLKDDDPPEVVEALRALSALGCHGDDMERAAELLRTRDCRGQFLIVGDDVLLSEFHHCLWADMPLFEGAAWIVRVPPAEVVEP